MFGAKKGSVPQSSIDSLIGVGTRIDGNVAFSGGLRVDGEVRGNISSCSDNGHPGTLVISEKASVEGEISVGHVVINGNVIGPVFASESLELLPAACVTGDVEYQLIEMQQGAVIQGRLVHRIGSRNTEIKAGSSVSELVSGSVFNTKIMKDSQ